MAFEVLGAGDAGQFGFGEGAGGRDGVDHRGLWISALTRNRVSYLLLDRDGGVASRHTAIRYDGGVAQTDSIAVDADGNLYQRLHGRPAMAVFDRCGEHLATVEVPADAAGAWSRRRTWRSRPAGPRRT
ncbi:hypothetical protein GCM10023079_55200 [Streptomyces chitinivorans]